MKEDYRGSSPYDDNPTGHMDARHITVAHADAPRRFLPERMKLSFVQKSQAVLGVLTVAAAAFYGPEIIDDIRDNSNASEYYAPEWTIDNEALTIWGNSIAQAAQDDRIESRQLVGGSEEVRVNIFDYGVESIDEGSGMISPFQNMNGISYGVLTSISRGNPEFVLTGTTGGIMPVNIGESQKIRDRLGIENFDTDDTEIQAIIFMRNLNDKAAALWAQNASDGSYKNAATPQLAQEQLIRDTLASYIKSLGESPGLPNVFTPLDPTQIAKVADVVFRLANDFKTTDSPTFAALLAVPETAPAFVEANNVVNKWALADRIHDPVLSEALEEQVDAAEESRQSQS